MHFRHPIPFNLSLLCGLLFLASPAFAQQLFTRTIDVNGLDREYLIYLPVDYDASQSLPALMWHHGGSDNAEVALSEADFRTLADSRRFIVAYPNALPDQTEGCNCWGYQQPGGLSNGNWDIDLAFTRALIDDLIATYNADQSRIYAGGYSMGASYTWDITCAMSDVIAAAAPVAASMYPWTFNNCDAALPTAVCHILGTDDFYAPYDGQEGWVPSAAAQHAFWVGKNQANTPAEEESLGDGVTRFIWTAGQGCHGVEHFRWGGGHVVPSFATTVIWDFVSQYSLEGLIDCGGDALTADFNGDGAVNGVDLGQLLGSWSSSNAPYDLDGSGKVDGGDLAIVLGAWTG
ncbi:MAG: PHB depolymerase family esterase [Planctomycetota bacterium]|nr:PHB depolymerase family esterase [Planctomycetota bacterium]